MTLLHPFFAVLALRLKYVESTTLYPPTAACDGVHCYYHPGFVDELNKHQLIGLIAHEVLHPALFHTTRRGNRDPIRWNWACDHAINLILTNSGVILPPGAVCDKKFKGMSAEAIYDAMGPEDLPPEDEWNIGVVMDAGSGPENQKDRVKEGKSPGQGLTHSDIAQAEKDWQMAVAQAAQVVKSQGKLPAGLEVFVNELLHPKIPWAAQLKPFFTKLTPQSHTWTRPNRRFIGQDIILPSVSFGNTGEVIVALDTSGSVSDSEFKQFTSEIICMLYNAKPEKLLVMYVDSSIHDIRTFTPNEPLNFKKLARKGYGGTSFIPPFTYCEEHNLNPHVLVYLTDGYGPFPDSPSRFPTVWVINNHEVKPPHGVHLVLE